MLRVTATAPGAVWLELDAPGVGRQHFGAADLAALRHEFPRGAVKARLAPDGALLVEGATLVAASTTLACSGPPPPVDLDAVKAERQAVLEATWAQFATAERLATLLHGRHVHTQDRPSLAWLRATPPDEWPPIFIRWNGDAALLTGGCHRVRVARELGIPSVKAQVHAGARVVYEGPVGV